jgi:DNA polymerase III sliding clamp (beta) subunit (PCNA family)
MKLPSNQIEKAAAGPKEARAYLRQVVLSVENKTLTACDGHILAVISIEPEAGDTSGYIPQDVFKAARKSKRGLIVAHGALDVVGAATFWRPTEASEGRYPPVYKIIPKKPNRAPDILLDAALLLRLAQAVNESGTCVKLWVIDKHAAVYAEPTKGDGFGVIMPLST